ncbi:hypothetical protein AVEN_231010-1 [Araneus ventricosus]|uniref:Uncharacterized protein n=1 Tax=Araneus ventricosus TaxID=182803 RepID=A0A4Y2A2V3_ARAVE|nr:hypothetical protein AVEN_231010-1 [Araneus ventricosus]
MKSAAHVDKRTAAFPRQSVRVGESSGIQGSRLTRLDSFIDREDPFSEPPACIHSTDKGMGLQKKRIATGVFASVLLSVMAKQDPTLQKVSSDEICRQIGYGEIYFG